MKKPGFTLLELMVTLGLFAAIMGVLMSVFFQFKDQNARFESIMGLRQEARILEHLLRQDLQAAVCLVEFAAPLEKGGEGNPTGIVGIDEQDGSLESDQVHMHVNRPSRFFRGLESAKDPEVHEISFFIDSESEARKQFSRREQFYIDGNITEGENSITHPLSENVVEFDVKYYTSDNSEPLDEWGTDDIQRTVEDAKHIPAGVQVTLIMKNQAGEQLESRFQINLQPAMGTGIEWRKAE